ncbi:MAG: GNAT family N-acetyltransferase [Capnocytophaga sp.]|nr:GNAT family N-acetyltransferase [Capnocytophaga sp.]
MYLRNNNQEERIMVTFLSKSLVTDVIEQDARRLFAQLSRRHQVPLSELFSDGNTATVAAYIEDGRLRGMASMAVYKVISGHKGWIEDVVVDETQRGKSIGRKLIQALVEHGKSIGLGEILLFTDMQKEAAICLYETEGFRQKGVEVFVNALKNMYPKE